MDIPLDEVVYFDVITSNPGTGAAVDADSTPTFAVYEEATDTDIGVGGNLTKRTSLTGDYRGTFTMSAANGFEVGKWYSVIASATVSGVAGKCRAMMLRCMAAEVTAGAPAVTLSSTERDSIGTALLDLAAGVETNRTVRQALRLMLASLAGKLAGAAGTAITIRDTNDSKNRISATVDASGNRTAVTYDAS